MLFRGGFIIISVVEVGKALPIHLEPRSRYIWLIALEETPVH